MPDTSSSPSLRVISPHGESIIPFQPGANLRTILLGAGMPLPSSCGGIALCGQCLVRVEGDAINPPTQGEQAQLTPAQLQQGFRLACQAIPQHDMRVRLEPPPAQGAWRPLREDEHAPFAANIAREGVRYGVAVDLGTTHIRITLLDRLQGRRLAGLAGLNPQRVFGADVLTRLMEAEGSPVQAQRITAAARQAIAGALSELALSSGVARREIGEVCVVSNTAMLTLLAGKNHGLLLQPEYWTRQIDCTPQDLDALRETWGLSATARIRLLPPLGGFIGSDILAGIIATRLMQSPPGSLLVDFGTNTEMVLWDGKVLHCISAAGGPAFEGSGIQCGMPGEAGAIYRVMPGAAGAFEVAVLGDGEAQGICGSGLVDAIACLRRDGRLDRIGRLQAPDAGLLLHAGARDIVLTRRDMDVFQRAKAAIGAGVRWLCSRAGIRLADLRRVYACGAFGRLLDIANAQTIGLLPPLAPAAVELQGNAALAGCEQALLSPGEAMEQALAATRVHNAAEEENFENFFVESLYLEPMQE